MARNGSGTYSLPAGNPVVTGTSISSTWANNTLNDISAALTQSVSVDGQTAITANLPMTGFKHTNVGNAAARTEYGAAGQVQDSAFHWLTFVSGTDTITATAAIGLAAYAAGQTFRFVSAGANTGTSVTLNLNGIGAKAVTKNGAVALAVGDIPSGCVVEVVYDGTRFQLVGVSVNHASTADNATNATNATTSTTAALGDSSTAIATTAFVQQNHQSKIQPVSASVSGNALTVGLNVTSLDFRSTTLTSGTVNTRAVTSPLSLTVSSGSTLGTVNAVAARIAILAIDNAGTVELAVVNLAGGNNLDETTLINTTAEGGAGAADSATAIYSATARTGVPFRVVGFVDITEATAGTWATAPTLVQGVGGQALASLGSLGYGQTWQDVKASRALGTTYYNTTGKPITVRTLAVASTQAGMSNVITVSGIGLASTSAFANAANYGTAEEFVVPAGASYSFTMTVTTGTATLSQWSELR